MNEWAVYILRSEATGQLYVGSSGDLAKRLDYHNRGLSRWTRGKGPWVLAYSEPCASRPEAVRRERQLKSWKSSRSLEQLIESQLVASNCHEERA